MPVYTLEFIQFEGDTRKETLLSASSKVGELGERATKDNEKYEEEYAILVSCFYDVMSSSEDCFNLHREEKKNYYLIKQWEE